MISYEIADCNVGFKSYVSTVKIVPRGGGDGKDEGCVIEWSVTVDPVEGWRLEDLVKRYQLVLDPISKNNTVFSRVRPRIMPFTIHFSFKFIWRWNFDSFW
ncbi:unnamed protein product [Camellia sinensis]